MKKYFVVLLAVLLLIASCACGEESTELGQNQAEEIDPASLYEWQEISGGVEITKYKGNEVCVSVPSTLNGKAVVSLGTAFSGNLQLQEITLPEYMTKADLTNCKSLKRLTALGIESTSDLKIDGCESLEYVSFPKMDTYRVDLPDSVRELDVSGLKWCDLTRFYGKSISKVDISGASVIYNATYFSKEYGIDVQINSNINKCYVVSQYDYNYDTGKESYTDRYYYMYVEGTDDFDGSRGYNASSDDIVKEITITDENRAKVYCEIFRCRKVTVNGVEYVCDSVVDTYRG